MCQQHDQSKRNTLKKGLGLCSLAALGGATTLVPTVSYAAALSQKERDAMTPDQVVEFLLKGNNRFLAEKPLNHDYTAQQKVSADDGQFPAAVLLSCIDSRAPAEIILDAGIGDLFNARVAGNVTNNDILGSMEFSCALAGAKVIMVMGHTKCGAVKGAIANVELGHLTGLLDQIKPAIAKTKFEGKREASNYEYVDAVAKTNVIMSVNQIRQQSKILRDLEKEGKIKIVGAMYDISSGVVRIVC